MFSKPTNLLWIHGWGMSAGIWDEATSLLIDFQHHFFTYKDCKTPEDMVLTLRQRLLEIGPSCAIIGWSLGGVLALQRFLQQELDNDREGSSIEALILIGSTACFATTDKSHKWSERVLERMSLNGENDRDASLAQYAHSMLATVKETFHAAYLKAALASDFCMEGLEAGLDYLKQTDLSDRWKEWVATKPHDQDRVLWIHGEEDVVCPAAALPKDCKKVIIPGAGHHPFLTDVQAVVKHVKEFLAT